MNITEFKSRLGNLASPAKFRVLFSGAIIDTEVSRGLAFLCNQAQMPGRSFATTEYTTHGPVRKVPYQNIYDDLVISIYCKENMDQKRIFQEWQNFICDTSINEYSYPDDYTTDIIIEQFGDDGEVTYACKFIDAYPVTVNPMDLDWSQQNAFMNLQVTFAYRYWREEPLPLNPFGNFLQVNSLYPNLDISGALNKFGVSVLSRADGQFMSKMKQGARFGSNLGKSASVRGAITNTVTKLDNFFIN
jgi:hypothetical protein